MEPSWVLVGVTLAAVCAVSCGIMAHYKHRPAYEWFLLGALFGIFALFVLTFMKNLGDYRECPHCNADVRRDAVACRFCSREVVPI